MALVDDLIIHNTDSLIGDGGNETAWKSFHKSNPHFVELVEASKNIDAAISILADDVIDSVFAESSTFYFVLVNM